MTDRRKAALEALKREIDKAKADYIAGCRAASAHNNTDGVGIHFNYMSSPPRPSWIEPAERLIEAFEHPDPSGGAANPNRSLDIAELGFSPD